MKKHENFWNTQVYKCKNYRKKTRAVVDFSDLAQGCKTYDEFIEKMKDISEAELNYFGIAICGSKKKVVEIIFPLVKHLQIHLDKLPSANIIY